MANIVKLASLIEAISRAIAHAQDQVERHQVLNLMRYFDKDARPLTMPLNLHSLNADPKNDAQETANAKTKANAKDIYHVPILGLVPVSSLKIKDATVKLSVDMGELIEEEVPEDLDQRNFASVGNLPKKKTIKTLNISTATGRGGGKIQISLTLQGCDVPEGTQRLVDYLNKIQGVHPPHEDPAAEERG
jgi:Protein of unknown function (DUF2589)